MAITRNLINSQLEIIETYKKFQKPKELNDILSKELKIDDLNIELMKYMTKLIRRLVISDRELLDQRWNK